jgi:carboxynorspermidine decarboxylase
VSINLIVRWPSAIGCRSSTPQATMVKKNWFNGLKMPSIVVKQLDGTVEVVREFGYDDYLSSLS